MPPGLRMRYPLPRISTALVPVTQITLMGPTSDIMYVQIPLPYIIPIKSSPEHDQIGAKPWTILHFSPVDQDGQTKYR